MPQSPYPMIPIADALAIINKKIQAGPTMSVSFQNAVGLVLAENVKATESMPPFAAAAVDGYAVKAADGPGWRRIVGNQMAGPVKKEPKVKAGTAVRVTTGAPIPSGADALVMVEETEEQDEQVNIKSSTIESGAFIRRVGQDIKKGQIVLPKGTLIGAAELGLLASIGLTEVTVYRRPVVGVMSTGDEIVQPHETPERGQIRDANRFTLMSLIEQVGAEPFDVGIIHDQERDLVQIMEYALDQVDLLLTSGGVSMGRRDLVKPYFALRGKVHFGRVNTKPGKPVTFATVNDTHCFAMPGFPVSAMVCFELFVRPALLKMMGRSEIYRKREQAVLEHTFHHDASRTEFQRVTLTRQSDGRLTASSTGFQGSGRLLSMVGANGLVELPDGQADYEAGTVVEAILLDIV